MTLVRLCHAESGLVSAATSAVEVPSPRAATQPSWSIRQLSTGDCMSRAGGKCSVHRACTGEVFTGGEKYLK